MGIYLFACCLYPSCCSEYINIQMSLFGRANELATENVLVFHAANNYFLFGNGMVQICINSESIVLY